MANRMVQCTKFRRELPGLESPPYPGEVGQRIYDNVSRMAWDMWQQQATILINHYGLNMADPRAQQFLLQHMEEFLFSEEAAMPEGWVPEDQQGGKGAPSKGAPAPQKK
jgi:Fe-S cluster biosynthesis and repair protein YggX